MHYLVTCRVALLIFQGEKSTASWPLFAYDYTLLYLTFGAGSFLRLPNAEAILRHLLSAHFRLNKQS